MTGRDFRGYLDDILIYCKKIQGFITGIEYEEFLDDEMRQLSIIRCLEVIGEASKHIPNEIRNLYPEIPWKVISGTRDYLIHDYSGVNVDLIWKTASNDIPGLIVSISRVIHDYE
jgi:uncharacterized protein with HEPN domain